eukprot:scaffold875_cov222-Pinguiococcus_pyrenoidosus.AAC.1
MNFSTCNFLLSLSPSMLASAMCAASDPAARKSRGRFACVVHCTTVSDVARHLVFRCWQQVHLKAGVAVLASLRTRKTVSHRIASHRIASHRIASHRIAC